MHADDSDPETSRRGSASSAPPAHVVCLGNSCRSQQPISDAGECGAADWSDRLRLVTVTSSSDKRCPGQDFLVDSAFSISLMAYSPARPPGSKRMLCVYVCESRHLD
jgi:hypothetical protein